VISQTVITYTYDALDRLTAADYSDGSFFHYAYDAAGNRLGETTQAESNVYTYDDANRLTGVTDGVSAVSYAYNGLGDRLQTSAGGQTTRYTLDLVSGLTQVLEDGGYTYLYGNGRIAQYGASGGEYFLGDALGSARQLVDASGAVRLTRSYQPYGELLASNGDGESMYGFTGEATDALTGMVYLRARWYAPQDGRFITRDTWKGDLNEPMSLNAWNYVQANPINYFDPGGMWRCQGHKDCEVWVMNALNMLNTSGETGRRLVNFFKQYDEEAKKSQSSAYEMMQRSPLYSSGLHDCNPKFFGVTISFEDVDYWGFAGISTMLVLDKGITVDNGLIPDAFGVTVFGHEISHWKQSLNRFSIQGEVLARYVEMQLSTDLGRNPDALTALINQIYPFSMKSLREAKRSFLNFSTYRSLPIIIGNGLPKSWLSDLAIPIPSDPSVTTTPMPQTRPPKLIPIPTSPLSTPIPLLPSNTPRP
jgi:RHS repeat-associated protein